MAVQIIPLSEGEFTVGRDKTFQPFNLEKDDLNERSTGSLLVEVQPFAIVTDEDIIICDLGLGFNNPLGNHMLIDNLAKHHIHPEDVTKVLLSHLHKDHTGGLSNTHFPNAIYYVYEKEYEFAKEKGKPSYFPDELKVLEHNSQVVWLKEESGIIDQYIEYFHTGGHSPQHIAYKIHTTEGIIFFGGDEAPQYKQMKMKYIAKYDHDGRKAMELRKDWAEQGSQEDWTFLFYHDVQNPFSKL